MFKNIASQKFAFFAFDATTSLPKTGDSANITPYVSKDYGTVTALGTATMTEMDATNAKGWYSCVLAQAETNADALLFSAKSSTANISVVGGLVYTTPPNFSTLAIDTTGSGKIQSGVKKNTAIAYFRFSMTLTGTSSPAAGKTVVVKRGIDSGTQVVGTLGTVTEIGNGEYWCSFAAADTNGTCIMFQATEASCNTVMIPILTDA